ncbi:MAG: hypothetical protein L0332_35720 [Chloroflexi bacterium]|nr:hypothetical protein [Chloroflexota bacterium]
MALALAMSGLAGRLGAAGAHGPAATGSEPAESPDLLELLHSQLDMVSSNAMNSQNFEAAYDSLDSQAADDFTVPPIDGLWIVRRIRVSGKYTAGPVSTGPVDSINVWFYADANGRPGATLFSRTNVAPWGGLNSGDFTFDLNPGLVLPAGTYWISVQGNMNTSAGRWNWQLRTAANWQDATWRNPNNGTGMNCLTWDVVANCSTFTEPDLGFELKGFKAPKHTFLPITPSLLPDGENNDICDDAYLINENTAYDFLPNDQTDWYHFYLAGSNNLSVEITNFTPIEGQLAVYKDRGGGCSDRQLLGNDGTPALTRFVNAGLQSAGHYYIFVGIDGPLSNTDYYRLRVHFP